MKGEGQTKEHEKIPSLNWAILQFLGTWSEKDNQHQLKLLGQKSNVMLVTERERPRLKDYNGVVLPGGFAHGDYLRTGAIASLHPVMDEVKRIAEQDKLVIGICNGFQILCEAGLLHGALTNNISMKFHCNPNIYLRVEQTDCLFTRSLEAGQVLKVPISHGEGNFQMLQEGLNAIEEQGLVVFRYCDEEGNISPEANPNGSLNNIAGIMNERGNVLGMMPHPERAAEKITGGVDGNLIMLSAIINYSKAT